MLHRHDILVCYFVISFTLFFSHSVYRIHSRVCVCLCSVHFYGLKKKMFKDNRIKVKSGENFNDDFIFHSFIFSFVWCTLQFTGISDTKCERVKNVEMPEKLRKMELVKMTLPFLSLHSM